MAFALFASLLSCGRELTGPNGRGALTALQFAPDFSAMVDSVGGVAYSVADLVPFNRVRIELRRLDNTVAAAQVVDFPSNATEVPLAISVRLGAAAQNGAEPLTAFLRYINAAGDTVFAGGPIAVTAESGRGQTEPVSIPIVPTAPGAVFASMSLSPDSAVANAGSTLTFTATGFDTQGGVVSNAIIGFLSRNPALVQVPNLGQGSVTLVGTRGSTWLVAQSLTGLRDSAFIRILPLPSQIVKVSGDAQTALQGAAFSQPLRVRVLASDNLPVAGATVSFAVASGGGSVSATTAQTDSAGFASVLWTAGSILGAASVTASVGTPAITTTFTGTQVNAGPTSLAFETEPVSITAGDTLPPIRVAVRNALGQPISGFTGVVSLTRVGTGGGFLVGDTAVAAVAGVATFRGLTLSRAGTDYRLVAVLGGVPNQLSSPFAVAAAPPHAIQLVSGGGQVSDPSTTLPAPIVVRVTDIFAQPVVGATVTFSVLAGDGIATPTSAATDANGQASTQWTLGPAGPQALRASAAPAPALDVAAQLTEAGALRVFAAYDSTLVRIGFERALPLYVSSASDTAITVSLSTNAPGLTWTAPTATFAPFARRTDLALAAADNLPPGTYWAYVASAIGDDSIMVSVDSAFVAFGQPYFTEVSPGDTVHIPVRLADPAPAGGITVRVVSLDTSYAKVMRGTGGGLVTPSCLNPVSCLVDNIVTTEGTPSDSVDLFIPPGDVMAHAAMLVTAPVGRGPALASLRASAERHRSDEVSFFGNDVTLNLDGQPSLVGHGLAKILSFTTSDANVSRDREIRLRSLSPAVFSVDSAVVIPRLRRFSVDFDIRGLAVGSGALEYGNAQLGYDTVSVTVVPPKLRVLNPVFSGTPSSTRTVLITVETPGSTSAERAMADLPITITSLDTMVARPALATVALAGGTPETQADLRLVGTGTTQLIAAAPGVLPDTITVTVSPVSVGVFPASGAIVVGSVVPWTANFVARSGDLGSPRRLQVQPRNPAIARVLVPDLDISRRQNTVVFEVIGRSVGADTADVFLDGLFVTSVPYVVTPAQLRINPSVIQNIDPDSTFTWTLPVFLTDSAGFLRSAADTIRAVLRSSDPTVLLVTDSIAEFLPGADPFAATVSVVGRQAGTASLTLSSAGFADVVETITVNPARISATLASEVGIGLTNAGWIRRTSTPSAALPLSITHQGSGRVEFLGGALVIPAGEGELDAVIEGITPGTDTVIVSAPGHAPDTTIITVVPSRARLLTDTSVSVGVTDDTLRAELSFDCSGTPSSPARDRRFVVTSTDTTKALILQDTIVVPAAGVATARRATVRYVSPGSVALVLRDVDAEFAPETLAVNVAPARIRGFTEWQPQYLPIGTRQRTYPNNMIVELDFEVLHDTWVRLTPSRPGLITLPDSVRIPTGQSFATFDLAAGDTVGTVRVTAGMPGFTPWEFDVTVTRSRLDVCGCSAYVGADNAVELYVLDGLESVTRPLNVATTVTLTSENPATASILTSDVILPAGLPFAFPRVLRGESPGRTQVRARDARGDVFGAFAPAVGRIEVTQPTLRSFQTRFLAAPGLASGDGSHAIGASLVRDTVVVRLASVLGRVQPVVDSVIVAKQTSGGFDSRALAVVQQSTTPFQLRGVSAGDDTLVFSAPGFTSWRVPVRVEPGILSLQSGTPTVITVGDSTRVRVNFAAPDGSAATTTDSVTFNFGFLGAGLRLGPSTVNAVDQSIVVPPGRSFVEFWVRATAPGLGTFEINSPSFRPLLLTFDARARPPELRAFP